MRHNFVPNPKAAVDVSGWTVDAAVTLTPTTWTAEGIPAPVVNGLAIATGFKTLINNTSGSHTVKPTEFTHLMTPGSVYLLSALVYRPSGAGGGTAYLGGNVYSSGHQTLAACATPTYIRSDFGIAAWIRHYWLAALPASGDTSDPTHLAGDTVLGPIIQSTTTLNEVIYFTAAQVETYFGGPLSAYPYGDGDTPGWSWDGLPNASGSSAAYVSGGMNTIAAKVQAALLAAIAANLPSTTSLSLGYPPGGLSDEQVWISGDFDSQIAWQTSGYGQRGEDSSCEVRVAITQATSDFAAARDRALVLAGCIEAAIAADHTLGGVVDRCEVRAIKGQEAIPEEHKRQFGVTLTVFWEGEETA